MLTAIAMGVFPDPETARRALVKEKDTYYPDQSAHEKFRKVYEHYKPLYQAVRPLIGA